MTLNLDRCLQLLFNYNDLPSFLEDGRAWSELESSRRFGLLVFNGLSAQTGYSLPQENKTMQ